MKTQYAKPFMTITELTLLGLPKDYLKQLSRADGAPIVKTLGGGKILFRTAELDDFMTEITKRVSARRKRR